MTFLVRSSVHFPVFHSSIHLFVGSFVRLLLHSFSWVFFLFSLSFFLCFNRIEQRVSFWTHSTSFKWRMYRINIQMNVCRCLHTHTHTAVHLPARPLPPTVLPHVFKNVILLVCHLLYALIFHSQDIPVSFLYLNWPLWNEFIYFCDSKGRKRCVYDWKRVSMCSPFSSFNWFHKMK